MRGYSEIGNPFLRHQRLTSTDFCFLSHQAFRFVISLDGVLSFCYHAMASKEESKNGCFDSRFGFRHLAATEAES